MKKDISDQLTVFIITSGKNPNYEHCVNALEKQTIKFELNIIKDFSPLPVAFQEMINRCNTPYYVEVDEDMVLNENAVELMYENIVNSSPEISMISFRLYDQHADFIIYGIKIYKYDVLKHYPYKLNHPSCEVEQIERFEKDGYRNKLHLDVVGKHSPYWTDELVYERYYNLMRKFCKYRYVWLQDMPRKLFFKVKNNPTDVNIFALLGAYQGIISSNLEDEKDFTKKLVEYNLMESYLVQPTQSTTYVTSNCNFNCEFCYRQHHKMTKAKDMTIDVLAYFFNKFPTIKSTCVCGFGEPLVSSEIVNILRWLKNNGIYCGMITNGSLLAEKYGLIRPFLPNYISVSLNAHNAEEHKKVTKTDTWGKVLDGIRCVLKYNETRLYVSSVVTKENFVHVPEILEVCRELGVNTIHLHNLLPHFSEEMNKDFWDLVLTKDDKWMIDELRNDKNASLIKRYPELIDRSGGKQTCKFPFLSVAFDGDGNISLCNSVLPCDNKYGNIFDNVVWNSEKAENFRKKYINKEISQCSMCYRNWVYE